MTDPNLRPETPRRNLIPFAFEEHTFRIVDKDGEPWFVLADVCRILDLGNPSQAASRLDGDERDTLINNEGRPGQGARSYLIINESGLYSLILTSRKEAAKRFKKWVTSVVLPSIRKTGAYSASAQPIPADWQPLHDRINCVWGAVPVGYFSIFKEMIELTGQLITRGVRVDHKTIPDISLGIAWGKHWVDRRYDDEFGPRVVYAHSYPPSYPQSKSNPQPVYCYPEDALPVFRRWVRDVYLKDGLPKYLSSKAAKGEIPTVVATAVLAAVQAPPPVPRLR